MQRRTASCLAAGLALPILVQPPAAARALAQEPYGGVEIAPGTAAAERVPASDSWVDVYDPWERMNRGIFWFNEQVDG